MLSGLQLIGDCREIKEIKEKLPLLSASDAAVLITGETGTGKEVLARNIHGLSHRNNDPFVAINSGGIPGSLFENELFGHKKGAYTQALENRKGLVEDASGGTLFLDEIDSMPLDVQPKLLRLLQEKEYRVIGDNRLRKVDVRFISATATDLSERMKSRTFRADLFYRLRVFHIEMPPLRNRKEDIPHLALYFIEKFGDNYEKKALELTCSSMDYLMDYDWPGNVRELEQAVQRAVIVCEGEMLKPVHFDLPAEGLNGNAAAVQRSRDQSYHSLKKNILEKFEAEYISSLLKMKKGNVTSAARLAQLDRRTFQRLMSKHGIDRFL